MNGGQQQKREQQALVVGKKKETPTKAIGIECILCVGVHRRGGDACSVPGSLENSWREFVWSQALAGGPQADKQARKASFSLHASIHAIMSSEANLCFFFIFQSIHP